MGFEDKYIEVSVDLDHAGLVWHPEIGDEVVDRSHLERVSILVDPQGLTPSELRETFLWLPTVEQLVTQFEARQAIIFHAGLNDSFDYEAVIRTSFGVIETAAANLRIAFATALKKLLTEAPSASLH